MRSPWSQDFAHADMAFADNFGDISAYVGGHDALTQHWKKVLRIPICELDYETLVTDTEVMLAGLCAFIDALARALDQSDGNAPVQSASVWQTSPSDYKISAGRWRHYVPYVPEPEKFGDRH